MGDNSYDAVIIGAGIIGAAIALELSRKGWKTLNVDKLPAAGYGSTSNSCAIIRTHYSTFDGAALAYEGYFYWKDWAGYLGVEDERGFALFQDCGCLIMKTEKNGNLRGMLANMDALRIPYEEWDPARIKQAYPFYDTHQYGPVRLPDDPGFGESDGSELTGGVFFPTAGYISDPQLATHNLQRAAEAAGAAFRFNATVAAIRKDGGRVAGVTLADGDEIDAPVVVNVAGPHSAIVNAMAGADTDMTITTRALRQEVVHVPAPPGGAFPFVASDSDIGVYARPEIGDHILAGSEDPECDEREWVDPDDYNQSLSKQAETQVMRLAQRIPALGIPNSLKGVVDLYDVSDDWIPIYDRSAVPGFYMAIGTSGNQFKNAPVAGALMAELIARCEAGHDHDADPVRFHLEHTGLDIDLGFYSRRREVNQESSFSVLG
jgi:sarcosine oxidase subunit beta